MQKENLLKKELREKGVFLFREIVDVFLVLVPLLFSRIFKPVRAKGHF